MFLSRGFNRVTALDFTTTSCLAEHGISRRLKVKNKVPSLLF